MINEANLSAVYGHDQKVFTDQSGGAVKVGTERRVRERKSERERERPGQTEVAKGENERRWKQERVGKSVFDID